MYLRLVPSVRIRITKRGTRWPVGQRTARTWEPLPSGPSANPSGGAAMSSPGRPGASHIRGKEYAMRRSAAVCAALAALALAACSSSMSSPVSLPSPVSPPSSSAVSLPRSSAPAHHHHRLTSRQAAARNAGACDPSLWRAIYHPFRLHVVAACKTVTGTVESVRSEPDGDVHLLLKLPASRSGLLNDGNLSDTHDDLVVEIICVGTVTQTDAESACAGHVNQVAVPSAGERIRITGTYVLDADHGWMEIHPVSRLSVLSAAAPVTQPSAPAAPAGCHPVTSSGNCYEPGEFCSDAEHGETGVAGDGKTITCVASGSYWRWED
jgi:hypothetical protein